MATEGKPLQRRRTWTMIAMDLKAIRGMSVEVGDDQVWNLIAGGQQRLTRFLEIRNLHGFLHLASKFAQNPSVGLTVIDYENL